ncbi:MAG: flagellar biosynthetic protein FliR [Sandaracinaceae bacterium]|nr:flagellar biosynthetic protein FliR [Sandaracinaceae bacterium]
MVLFVLVGGHRVALAAFAGTFAAAPVGAGASAADLASFALGAGRLVTASLELAVAFAAPAAIAFVLLELALGVAGARGARPAPLVRGDAAPRRARRRRGAPRARRAPPAPLAALRRGRRGRRAARGGARRIVLTAPRGS